VRFKISPYFLRFEILLLLLTSFGNVTAQYMQFSQYDFAAQRVNPAMIGTSAYASLDLLTRNQKTGGDFSINSNIASAAYPLINASTGRPWAGIGLSVMDDRSSGIFNTQQLGLTYAANIRLDRYRILSLGVKGLFQTQSISLNGFYTGSQYITDRGFDGSLSNNEPFNEVKKNLTTFSAGIYWQQVDRNGKITAYWGGSFFDFNKPANSFFNSNSQLASTFVFHGGFEAYRQANWAIFPEVLFTGSAGNHVVNFGARTIFDINNPIRKQAEHLDLITKYVPGRSAIVGLQLHRENFSFGVSYDFPAFVTNTGNLGALEVGLSIRKLVKRKIKSKNSPQAKKPTATKNGMVRRPSFKPKPMTKPDSIKMDSLKALASQPEVEVQKIEPEKQQEISGQGAAGKLTSEPLLVEKITLRFHFDFNSVDLDDETEEFLDNLSNTLKEDPKLKMRITGHTDNIGHEKFNQRLSVKRAEAIKNFLIKRKIDPARIEVEGKGLSEPVESNETEAGRAKNRRVEISVFRTQ
jgi:type IX secretion system PorP/SprF family membrane protein